MKQTTKPGGSYDQLRRLNQDWSSTGPLPDGVEDDLFDVFARYDGERIGTIMITDFVYDPECGLPPPWYSVEDLERGEAVPEPPWAFSAIPPMEPMEV